MKWNSQTGSPPSFLPRYILLRTGLIPPFPADSYESVMELLTSSISFFGEFCSARSGAFGVMGDQATSGKGPLRRLRVIFVIGQSSATPMEPGTALSGPGHQAQKLMTVNRSFSSSGDDSAKAKQADRSRHRRDKEKLGFPRHILLLLVRRGLSDSHPGPKLEPVVAFNAEVTERRKQTELPANRAATGAENPLKRRLTVSSAEDGSPQGSDQVSPERFAVAGKPIHRTSSVTYKRIRPRRGYRVLVIGSSRTSLNSSCTAGSYLCSTPHLSVMLDIGAMSIERPSMSHQTDHGIRVCVPAKNAPRSRSTPVTPRCLLVDESPTPERHHPPSVWEKR